NTVESAGIVLGHVAPVPWSSRVAEESIRGKAINDETATAAGAAAVAGAKTLTANRHNGQLAKVAVKRALLEAGPAKDREEWRDAQSNAGPLQHGRSRSLPLPPVERTVHSGREGSARSRCKRRPVLVHAYSEVHRSRRP